MLDFHGTVFFTVSVPASKAFERWPVERRAPHRGLAVFRSVRRHHMASAAAPSVRRHVQALVSPLKRRVSKATVASVTSRTRSPALHDTVLKRYRVAAGSARTIHDYLRPPRLPSLPRFFHPSRLFSLRDPSYTHDSAIEIATGIAPHDSAMEIATGIAPASSRTRRPKLHSPPLNFPLIRHSTQVTSTSQITSQNFGREDRLRLRSQDSFLRLWRRRSSQSTGYFVVTVPQIQILK